MKTVYVITGNMGSYDDFEEWIVRIVASQPRAQQLVIQLQNEADTYQKGGAEPTIDENVPRYPRVIYAFHEAKMETE
jgi:hypothetical protein